MAPSTRNTATEASVFFHADVDAFFAAVEQADNPDLAGKPVIVGAAPGSRGVVAACSYAARKFGIHSAMPITVAQRLCPHAVFLPVRMDRYLEISRRVMGIFSHYAPELEQISIDEAFLNMTGTERLWGTPPAAARLIKDLVRADCGLTVSIGIAPNRFLAKLASEFKKPDGLFRVEAGAEQEFLDQLRLRDLWGVGEKTEQRLRELNITSVAMLRSFPLAMLQRLLGQAAGAYLHAAARGQDPGVFNPQPKSRSISTETTFEADRKDAEGLCAVLLELCHQVVFRLLSENLRARTVVLRIRFHDFEQVQAQCSADDWLNSASQVYKIAERLFAGKWDGKKTIRLLGIGLAQVKAPDPHYQPDLFEDKTLREHRVEEAVMKLKALLPESPITKARLLKPRHGPKSETGELPRPDDSSGQ